jgi:hypothetical protein
MFFLDLFAPLSSLLSLFLALKMSSDAEAEAKQVPEPEPEQEPEPEPEPEQELEPNPWLRLGNNGDPNKGADGTHCGIPWGWGATSPYIAPTKVFKWDD